MNSSDVKIYSGQFSNGEIRGFHGKKGQSKSFHVKLKNCKELTLTYSRMDIPARLTTKVHMLSNKKAFYGLGLDSNGFFIIQGQKVKGTNQGSVLKGKPFEGTVVYGGKYKLQLNGVVNEVNNVFNFKGSWQNLANNMTGEFDLSQSTSNVQGFGVTHGIGGSAAQDQLLAQCMFGGRFFNLAEYQSANSGVNLSPAGAGFGN